MRIVGLDLSLTSTGVGVIEDGRAWVGRITTGTRRGHPRLRHLKTEVSRYAAGADLLLVEGPSYGSPFKAFDMGGGWWVVMDHLYDMGHQVYVVVSPSQVKMYATGVGGGPNAGKDHVLAAVIRRYPMVEVTGNDQADGLVLAAMGADQAGSPLVPVPKSHRRALVSVRWPASLAAPEGLPAVEGTLI
jgi:crossover junction endodeoxyribonuclease RuvC